MFLVSEHEGLFLWSSTEITQLKHIHSEMEVEAHFAVHAECCRLTARTGALAWCAMTKLPCQLQHMSTGTPACFSGAVARDWWELFLTYPVFPLCSKSRLGESIGGTRSNKDIMRGKEVLWAT